MSKHALWKWFIALVVVGFVLSLNGQAYQSAWTSKIVAEGPDSSKKRVITPDIAVVEKNVYVAYIEDETSTVVLLVSNDGGANFTKVEVAKPGKRVMSATVAASANRICVAWQDADFTIQSRCRSGADWLSDALQVSTSGATAGQHDFQGEWSGGLDNALAADGTAYTVWVENMETFKAAKSADGKAWAVCGDIPDQPGNATRYPTVYVDGKGTVWAGTATTDAKPEILVWMSADGCASWKGPTNVSNNSGFSDAPGLARIGDKLFEVNDDDTTNPNDADILLHTCDATAEGAANCKQAAILLKNGGFPHIATDGKGLYVTADNHQTKKPLYNYSCDAGVTWTPGEAPQTSGQVFIRDPDFGVTYSRVRIAVGDDVHLIWFDRAEGKSRIWIATRPKDCK